MYKFVIFLYKPVLINIGNDHSCTMNKELFLTKIPNKTFIGNVFFLNAFFLNRLGVSSINVSIRMRVWPSLLHHLLMVYLCYIAISFFLLEVQERQKAPL